MEDPNKVINLQVTVLEGAMIRLMLEASLEQYNEASDEEKKDPCVALLAQTCTRLIPYLPKAE